jgi:hypothetical protein
MKRKSPRGIPDFSSKRGGFKQASKADVLKPTNVPPPPPPKIKPQSTSGKSGNRGG